MEVISSFRKVGKWLWVLGFLIVCTDWLDPLVTQRLGGRPSGGG